MVIKNEGLVEKKETKVKAAQAIKKETKASEPVIEKKPVENKVVRRFKNKAIGI